MASSFSPTASRRRGGVDIGLVVGGGGERLLEGAVECTDERLHDHGLADQDEVGVGGAPLRCRQHRWPRRTPRSRWAAPRRSAGPPRRPRPASRPARRAGRRRRSGRWRAGACPRRGRAWACWTTAWSRPGPACRPTTQVRSGPSVVSSSCWISDGAASADTGSHTTPRAPRAGRSLCFESLEQGVADLGEPRAAAGQRGRPPA